jgi:hypothetical protein
LGIVATMANAECRRRNQLQPLKPNIGFKWALRVLSQKVNTAITSKIKPSSSHLKFSPKKTIWLNRVLCNW